MQVTAIVPQLRTADLPGSIAFYTGRLGMTLAFRFDDFYAGIQAGMQLFHLKRIDHPDPSIPFVRQGEHFHLYFDVADVDETASQLRRNGVPLLREVHDTAWGTREFVIQDEQGHVLYFGGRRP